MKRKEKQILAQRYALACLNCFADTFSYDILQTIQNAADFLSVHDRIVFFLQVPLIRDSVKVEMFERICVMYSLPQWCARLFDVLLAHKRAWLISDVMHAFVSEYMKKNNIEIVFVSSVLELTQKQREQCEALLKQICKKISICKYTQDSTLIAGVRMQSSTALWERSIKKQLRILHQRFVR